MKALDQQVRDLAIEFYAGKKRNSGYPAIIHPAMVAFLGEHIKNYFPDADVAKSIMWGHDLVEDSGSIRILDTFILRNGLSDKVDKIKNGIQSISHEDGVPYTAYSLKLFTAIPSTGDEFLDGFLRISKFFDMYVNVLPNDVLLPESADKYSGFIGLDFKQFYENQIGEELILNPKMQDQEVHDSKMSARALDLFLNYLPVIEAHISDQNYHSTLMIPPGVIENIKKDIGSVFSRELCSLRIPKEILQSMEKFRMQPITQYNDVNSGQSLLSFAPSAHYGSNSDQLYAVMYDLIIDLPRRNESNSKEYENRFNVLLEAKANPLFLNTIRRMGEHRGRDRTVIDKALINVGAAL